MDDLPSLPHKLVSRLLKRLDIAHHARRLAQVFEESEEGVHVAGLGEALRTANVKQARTALMPWERFDLSSLPALVCWDGEWWLADGQGKQVALLSGDGRTMVVMPKVLTGARVIWLTNRAAATEKLGNSPATRLVMSELFARRRWLLDVSLATLVINLLAVSVSLYAMQVYDRVVPTLAYATLKTLVVGMCIVVALDWILKTLRARVLDRVAVDVDRRISQRIFDHVAGLYLDTRPNSLGTLASQVSGLDTLRNFFSSTVIFGLVDLPFALMFITFIWVIGGPVAWVYVTLLPLALVLGIVSQARLRRLMREQVMRAHERQGMLVDTINGAESIHSSGSGGRFADLWAQLTSSVAIYGYRAKRISNRTTVTTGSLSTLAYVSAVVVGVVEVEAGHLTMGGIIACSILGGRVIAPIAQGVQHLVQWQNVAQSLRMLNYVLGLESRSGKEPGLQPTTAPREITLEGVQFAYPDTPVRRLDVANLAFKAGDRVVVWGEIGSGKSTLLKVIAGVYRPQLGRVKIDGVDVGQLDGRWLNRQVGYLPQGISLFKGTLGSNMNLADTAGDDDLVTVTQSLGIDRIASGGMFGMDLPISEGGSGLSMGQKQLVALARIVLARPRIWLLDEPTAALDASSEVDVIRTLSDRVRAEDIVIITTHAQSGIVSLANRALRVQAGSVVADGSPAEVAKTLGPRRQRIRDIPSRLGRGVPDVG